MLDRLLKPKLFLPLLSSSTRMMASFSRKKLLVTRKVPASAITMLSKEFELLHYDEEDPIPRQKLLEWIPDCDALFCLLTDRIDAEVLQAAGPSLKMIGTMSVGVDHIDLAAVKERNIVLGYTPDVLNDATAELCVALLLATSRNIVRGVNAVKSGEWSSWRPLWMCGQGLLNSTVGIVGLGRIGMGVARRLHPFGVNQFLYSGNSKKPYAQEIGAELVPLQDLLSRSDFVIASCALTPDTKQMFNMERFSLMKPTAIFVNISRGDVVNQDHLYQALDQGIILAAGIDVTTPEPLPTSHPLLTLDNCVVLPHIGSATVDTRTLMATLTARNILAYFHQQPLPSQYAL